MTLAHEKDSEKLKCDTIDLSACNQLQSYGVLLVIDSKTHAILKFSENASELLKTPESVLKQYEINHFLMSDLKSFSVREWITNSDKRYGRFLWKSEANQFQVWVYIHQQTDVIILEVEMGEEAALEEKIFSMIDGVINLNMDCVIQNSSECGIKICQYLASITEYDRVILYKFENDHSGVVIGEAITQGLESYLGLRFPATDIPESVRAMYLRQPLRYFPNIDEPPIKLLPDIASEELDFSDLLLRAISPVHREYLHNMTVVSSLSVAIIHNHQLWGLIACQHKTPKKLSLCYRFGLLLLAKIVAKQLTLIDKTNFNQEKQDLFKGMQKIQGLIYSENDLSNVFEKIKTPLLTLFSAQGIAYLYKSRLRLSGLTPNNKQIRHLVKWFGKRSQFNIFSTHFLSVDYPQAREFTVPTCGLLIIPLTPDNKHYLLLFRNELKSQITWAGDPGNVVISKGENYSPRRSFAAWKEVVHNQSAKWRSCEISAAKVLRQTLINKQLQQLLFEQEINSVIKKEEESKMQALQKNEVQLENIVHERTQQLSEKNIALSEAIKNLKTLQNNIIHAEKMATIGQLSAGIAHEINNPLSYLLNNIYTLQKYFKILQTLLDAHTKLMDELKQNTTYKVTNLYNDIILFNQNNKIFSKLANLDSIFFESIEGALRIKQIVSHLAAFSGGAREREEYTDVNSVIEAALEITLNELKYKCEITKNLSKLPKTFIAPKQLEIVFVNLLMNAAQSIPNKGKIKIESSLSDSTIHIAITDTGTGISEENLPRLFTPFFTTKPIGSGTGLSLSMAHAFIDESGGSIEVQTKWGQGSTFTVHLPIKITG